MDKNWVGFEELVAVASAGSFVGASRLLGVSTSHVSRAISALEERSNSLLFFRTTRRVHPTDAGQELVERAKRLIEDRDAAIAVIRGDGEPRGEIKITCSVHLGERFVAPITQRFASDYPNISIVLELSNRLVDLVGEGYDLGIRTGDVADDRLVGTVIGSRPFYLCAAPSYLSKFKTPRLITDLEHHECLVGNARIWRFRDNNQPFVYEPSGRWSCSSSAAIVEAAIAGMGVCQLPALYVAEHIRSGKLVRLLPNLEEQPEKIWAINPRRFHSFSKVESLIERLSIELPRDMTASEK